MKLQGPLNTQVARQDHSDKIGHDQSDSAAGQQKEENTGRHVSRAACNEDNTQTF